MTRVSFDTFKIISNLRNLLVGLRRIWVIQYTHRQRLHTVIVKLETGRPIQQLSLDVDLFQLFQIAQIFQLGDFVVPQIELFQVLQAIQILNFPQIVPLQVEMR